MNIQLRKMNELKEKIRDLAKEFELKEDEILTWTKVMKDKGMVDLGYTFRGEAILKKPNKPI